MNAEFDKDGYPTEGSLENILAFDGTPRELIDYIEELWWGIAEGEPPRVEAKPADDRNPRDYYRWFIPTFGWSGNETIIGELEQTMFWMRYWEMSRRGGGYTFYIPQEQMDSPAFLGSWKRYAEAGRNQRETAGTDQIQDS